jgi:hypothetical protein
MEKENMPMSNHGKTCGWCGLDKGFSWMRLILAIVLGLFIFFAGMVLGQMRASGGYDRGMMMRHSRGGYNQDNMGLMQPVQMDGQAVPVGTTTTTIVSPAQPATPVPAK